MPPNFSRLVLGPIYSLKGIAARFTPQGEDGAIAFTVTEDSSGAELSPGGILTVQSIKRAVRVRLGELVDKDLKADDLVGGALTFNGESFTIKTHLPAVGPSGPAEGEIVLTLERA